MNSVLTAAKRLICLVYPSTCASCANALPSTDRYGVCPSCANDIMPNPVPQCKICGKAEASDKNLCSDCRTSAPAFSIARSACLYDGTLKELIHAFKYRGRIRLAGIFSEKLIGFVNNNRYIVDGIDAVTFVPLTAQRQRDRTFNQSMALAKELAANYDIPLENCLKKVRDTPPQNELTRNERLLNLKGAFVLNGRFGLAGKTIFLVDDVMTTGATLNECALTLLSGGAKEVRCLTLARGI